MHVAWSSKGDKDNQVPGSSPPRDRAIDTVDKLIDKIYAYEKAKAKDVELLVPKRNVYESIAGISVTVGELLQMDERLQVEPLAAIKKRPEINQRESA